MAKNIFVSLGDHFADFIDAQVTSGRFGSASEVVQAGLRLLEERDMRLASLRDALIEGENSGQPKPFDRAVFMSRMRDKERPKRRRGR